MGHWSCSTFVAIFLCKVFFRNVHSAALFENDDLKGSQNDLQTEMKNQSSSNNSLGNSKLKKTNKTFVLLGTSLQVCLRTLYCLTVSIMIYFRGRCSRWRSKIAAVVLSGSRTGHGPDRLTPHCDNCQVSPFPPLPGELQTLPAPRGRRRQPVRSGGGVPECVGPDGGSWGDSGRAG